MTPQLWQRLKPLFHAALDRKAEDRAAFLSFACREDIELKRHLEKLLEAEAQPTGSLDEPLTGVSDLFSVDRTRFHDGETVLGRFRIVRFIGRGGMGEVYEAEDLELGVIALKTIRREIASSPAAFDRFRQEVVLARKISGPQICRIHELFLLPASDGHEATVFLTMEYLDGVTLSSRLAQDGPMPWKEALGVALDLCEGLRLIHAQGIIHRDLKSGNIMLCRQGSRTRTVLMDFGLAQDFDAAPGQLTSTSSQKESVSGRIVGTPEYMAPEQFEGKPVTPATDIYALGIVLYELVTGIHPYAGPTPIAAAIRRARHPASPSTVKPKIPRQWDRVIERCLEYEPAKRFQFATEVASALRPGPANLRYLRKDRPWIFRGVCALVFATLAWGVAHWWQTRQYYRPSAEALRWYDSGVSALREGNYVKATRSLQEAIALDNKFVMAHARLAEAWADLDFDGNAQRELLIAAPSGGHLKPLDRLYLEAIHATIMKDHPAEVAIYRQILNRLPPDQKSSGYVDIGMAYERAGDTTHALENYTKAESLDADNPAPFMHTAVIQTRLHHVPEAKRDFQRAQTLFTAEMNEEGLAELDYVHGLAAIDSGSLPEARQYLERSLDEARKIPSVQLQIRALVQLSSLASRSDAAPQSEEYAEQAIRLARENQLDVWAANGLIRLAIAQIHEGNFQQAEENLQEALKVAHQGQELRVEALANLTLASLMNQKHLPDQVIGPAQAALDYYKKNGYFVLSANASLLLIRSQRDNGQYQKALQSANEFLASATSSGLHDQMRLAEELIGTVLLRMEQYPDALVHFQNAASLADTASGKAYEAAYSADTLWKLGRYAESDTMLQFKPVNDILMTWVGEVRTASLLSRGRYREALSLARKMPNKYPKMSSSDQQGFELDRAIAESHLGMKQQALNDLDDLERREKTNNFGDEAARNLAITEVSLATGLVQQAHDAAVQAAAHYASTGQVDSELHSVCLAASASKLLKDAKEYSKFSTKAVDIVAQIQHTWSPQVSQTYLSRPDIRMLLREIPVVAHSRRSP